MLNTEKIDLIHKIVQPYYNFELNDIYGDRGSNIMPNIEKLNILFFKKNGKDNLCCLTKYEDKLILNKIKQMKFGKVEIIKINSIGIFITIENNIIEEKIEQIWIIRIKLY